MAATSAHMDQIEVNEQFLSYFRPLLRAPFRSGPGERGWRGGGEHYNIQYWHLARYVAYCCFG